MGPLYSLAAQATPGTTGVTISGDAIERVAMPALFVVVLILAGQAFKSRRRG